MKHTNDIINSTRTNEKQSKNNLYTSSSKLYAYNIKSKYKANKTVVDNIKFDSKKEANRYLELKMLEKANKIKDLKLQVPFELQESYVIEGKKIRAIKYIADFTYIESDKLVVEDVKGIKTEVYKLKKKLFEKKYNIKIKEI